MIEKHEIIKAYEAIGKVYAKKLHDYEEFKKRNPDEDVCKEEWIIGTLITDLLVAKGELDPSYIDSYNY